MVERRETRDPLNRIRIGRDREEGRREQEHRRSLDERDSTPCPARCHDVVAAALAPANADRSPPRPEAQAGPRPIRSGRALPPRPGRDRVEEAPEQAPRFSPTATSAGPIGVESIESYVFMYFSFQNTFVLL